MKTLVRLAGLALVILALIQFIRPTLTNPAVTAEIQAPQQVKDVLRRSCYSCHSNETELPWFDRVIPAYWLVTQDVKAARSHLNFSEIGRLPLAAQRAVLFEAVAQIELGAMPLPRYLKAHPGAALRPEDLAVLKAYLDPFGKPLVATTETAGDDPAKAWPKTEATASTVQPALNGMAFIPEYKNWKAISTTDRRDNHTIRVITANDIAIKAIESKQVQPWPDGAAFAKIAWDQVIDGDGVIHAGKFEQVEFMVKDKTKYASTAGWGFARWRGMELKPYGKDAHFAGECVSCHRR